MAIRNRLEKKVLTYGPVKGMIRRSKSTYVPGMSGFSLYDVWQPFVQQLHSANILERAAAISFNVFMAIPPTVIFVFTLVPYLPISDQFLRELYGLIRDIVPGEKDNAIIIGFLQDFLLQPRNELLSFGLFLALIFSSNAMMGVLRSFDKDYVGFRRRSGIRRRQTAMKLTFVVFVLVFTCILLLIAQGAVLNWIGIKNQVLNLIISNARWIIIILLLYITTSVIYRHGPARAQKWPLRTPGSVFATTLMIFSSFLVSFWVEHFSNYNKLYGSISAIFILMVLIYVNSLIVLVGFELNVTFDGLKRLKNKPAS